jgi:hypothetical protein
LLIVSLSDDQRSGNLLLCRKAATCNSRRASG